LTGNPVRKDLINIAQKNKEAKEYFKLDLQKKVILIVGGSLGARTINNSVLNALDQIKDSEVQLIWQTGKFYFDKVKEELKSWDLDNVKVFDFVSRMDLAYAAADIVISRAGAGTISELCLVEKPSILVPSPNVAEDHQTQNAMALVKKNAALMVKDVEAQQKLIKEALSLIKDADLLEELAKNSKALAKPNAADDIANEILAML
jgi:UDP-N-acetylglucosamine--N-acetylmuramyl-(pentapeptide) pyrophosphoryl-undecaprenol N-acetylglucosamine transferase